MRSQLKLWRPEDESNPPTPWEAIHWDGKRHVDDAVVDGRQVHSGWRLSEFLRRYFGPCCLFGGDDPAADKTILGYWDAVRWAVRVDSDRLLAELSEGWLTQVQTRLSAASYTRGRLCTARTLSADTRFKHSRQLRTILRELAWLGVVGPLRPRRKSRRRGRKDRPQPKPAYTPTELRAVVSAAERIKVRGFEASRLRSLWRVIFGLGFYTGLRRESLLAVAWSEVTTMDAEPWLRVPAELTKDREPWDGPIHPLLWAELLQLHGHNPPASTKLLPWPHKPDWLLERVKQAVAEAGIIAGRGRDIHGLRRAHEQAMLASGFDLEKQTAARLLNHSDPGTTFKYYAHLGQLRSKYIRGMPPIW